MTNRQGLFLFFVYNNRKIEGKCQLSMFERQRGYITQNKDYILFFIGFFILLITAFGIGFLLGNQNNPAPIIIEKCSEQ